MSIGGELVPVGGGDNIPLVRDRLTVGRRPSCDICLQFPTISKCHCEFVYQDGYWLIRDLSSTNGIRVNGEAVREKALKPGDEIAIGSRMFTIDYTLLAGQQALNELMEDNIMDLPLLEKAGLVRPRREDRHAKRPRKP